VPQLVCGDGVETPAVKLVRFGPCRRRTADLKDRKIRVNAVSPGVIPSPGYRDSAGMTEEVGGRGRDRTGDPLLAKQMLSQLSYTPNPISQS
jgi:NAD(P)-dependent dehydrogenase (short-subunit alcohol dehydrogenase family)